MARQYGTKRSSRQRGSAPHQFLIFIITFSLGYLTASVFDIDTIKHWMNTQLAYEQAKQQLIKREKQQVQIPPKPKFEFYTLLTNEKNTGATTQSNINNRPSHSSASNPENQNPSAATVATAASHSVKQPPSLPQTAVAKVTEVTRSVPTRIPHRNYLVQVASFKVRQDAEDMKGMLILKGFNVIVVPVQARGQWFRVVVGPYSNRILAQKAQEVLVKNERIKGMIIHAG